MDRAQLEARKILINKKRIYLSWSIGSGKTFFCSHVSKEIVDKGGVVHIVCPKGVIVSFEEEFKKLGVDYLKLDDKDTKQKFFDKKIGSQVVLFTLAGFREHYDLKNFNKPNLLIFDECHNFKSAKSKQSKRARLVAKFDIDYIIMASGTPIGNNLMDIWNQIFILDKGMRLGRVFKDFELRYFYDLNVRRRGTQGYFPKLVPRKDAVDNVVLKIKDILHINEGNQIKMPEVKTIQISVPQTQVQLDIAKDIKKQGSIDIKKTEKRLRFTHTLEILTKLRQVSCGFVYMNGKVYNFDNHRLKVLKRVLFLLNKEQGHKKIIVWSVYRHTYSQIKQVCTELGLGCVELVGGMSQSKFSKSVSSFKNDSSIQVVVSHPKSGGAGLNLQCASASIMYSQDYSYIDKIQKQGRNFRRGSFDLHKTILRVNLIAKNSIEERIEKALKDKQDFVQVFKEELLDF